MIEKEKTYIHLITEYNTEKNMITKKTKEGYEVLDPNKNWYYKIKYLGKIRIIKELWDNTVILIWSQWRKVEALLTILTEEERRSKPWH